MVFFQGLRLAMIGVALGMCIALGLTHLIAGFLFGVKAQDPSVFVISPILLSAVALLAVLRPCSPQKQKSWLCGLLYQAILMMQAAKHRRFHSTVTGGQLVSVVAGRNLVLVGLRNSRT